jgi:hypothetical protein
MLIKFNDRLTVDAFLALRALGSGGGSGIWETLVEADRDATSHLEEPPIHQDPSKAIRFFWNDEDNRKPMALDKFTGLFSQQAASSPILLPITYPLRSNAQALQEFMAGSSHEELPFRDGPLFLIYARGAKGVFATARQGRIGRKYARSPKEISDFLASHPQVESLLSDVQYRLMGREKVATVVELSAFMQKDPRHPDLVIDTASVMAGYFFARDPFGDAIAEKQSWFFEINPEAYTTIDMETWALREGDPRPHVVPLETARENLRSALADISRFAGEHELMDDRAYFDRVASMIDQKDEPLPPLFKRAALSGEAYALFRAAIASDVFAGMASWNDVEIEKGPEYRRVSNQLCLALLDAVCGSVSEA